MLRFVWGREGFSSGQLPSQTERDIEDTRYTDLPNRRRIVRLTVKMDWRLNSIAHHFLPRGANGKLVIYYQGHRGDFALGKDPISAFMEEEYSVIALSTPLLGPNAQPIVDFHNIAGLKLTSHDHLKFLAVEEGHPIQFFLQPVAAV